MRKISCYVFCLLGLLACKPDDDDVVTPDYLVFGLYYGECYGGETCIEIYKLQNKSLFEDTNDKYPTGKQAYKGNYVLQNDLQYQKVKDLINAVPTKLLKEKNNIIGQPDAGDWGGIYVEIKRKGTLKFYLIDTQTENIPSYLHSFTNEVKRRVKELN